MAEAFGEVFAWSTVSHFLRCNGFKIFPSYLARTSTHCRVISKQQLTAPLMRSWVSTRTLAHGFKMKVSDFGFRICGFWASGCNRKAATCLYSWILAKSFSFSEAMTWELAASSQSWTHASYFEMVGWVQSLSVGACDADSAPVHEPNITCCSSYYDDDYFYTDTTGRMTYKLWKSP